MAAAGPGRPRKAKAPGALTVDRTERFYKIDQLLQERQAVPLELVDHLSALVPPPRRHRHRYHRVLAPSASLPAALTAYGRNADAAHLRGHWPMLLRSHCPRPLRQRLPMRRACARAHAAT